MSAILPSPRTAIAIRPATLSDLPFIDQLQSKHTKMVGWMPTKQLEGKIAAGNILVAWPSRPCSLEKEDMAETAMLREEPVGYVIAQDRYFKHDDVGIIYQLNVLPVQHRKLIGATLIKAVFERAAYGCKLFCCWCAQDIDANYFWESLGFIPLAFRAGSSGKKRVHIFWQKRIGEGDCVTPYWYPFQTNAGAIREDRLVFPIPPGVHWKDVEAVALPSRETPKLEARSTKQIRNPKPRIRNGAGPGKVAILVGGRIKYIDRPGYVAPEATNPAAKKVKPKRAPAKIDPKYLSAARELRDRYLEHLNGFNAGVLADGRALPVGKYAVSKALPVPAAAPAPAFGCSIKSLPVAA